MYTYPFCLSFQPPTYRMLGELVTEATHASSQSWLSLNARPHRDGWTNMLHSKRRAVTSVGVQSSAAPLNVTHETFLLSGLLVTFLPAGC
jgi:hypothetical protein